MDLRQAFTKVAIALALGLLVGMQRERTRSRVAGIRTFALITLFGAVAALAEGAVGWLVAAGAIALAAMLVVANLGKMKADSDATYDPGLTTEVAVLLMYCVGVFVVVGPTAIAVAVGGAVVLLLHLKQPLHRLIRAMGEHDVSAVMQFALITLVILPVLPNRTFGPLDVLNPYKIWLMVVLIVAISLGGYVAFKLMGTRASALLGGVLGGLVSSTATTVSYARRTGEGEPSDKSGAHAAAGLAAMIIVVASAISVVRVVVEVAVVAPNHLRAIGMPLGAMIGWMFVLAAAAYIFRGSDGGGKFPEPKNPAELKPAIIFGLLYAVVILAVAVVRKHFGDAGLYPVAIVSGLTDMDAITLSTANLAKDGRLDTRLAWQLILMAALANLVFKGVVAAVLGSPALRGRIAIYFGLGLAGGVAILLLWP
jgi:uncharacterized membrane protein (DUF4010 family)